MSTYREALWAARMGETVKRNGEDGRERVVRLLTEDEANAYLLEHMPHRSVRHDEHGRLLLDEHGAPIIDTHAPLEFRRRLGLFVVGDGATPVPFRPTEEDLVSDWELPEGFVLAPDALIGTADGRLRSVAELAGHSPETKTEAPPLPGDHEPVTTPDALALDEDGIEGR